MAVNLSIPQRESLLPIPGVELGVAMAGVKKPGLKDLLVMRLAPGSAPAATAASAAPAFPARRE